MQPVKIDCSKIPSVEQRNLFRTFAADFKAFSENPENVREFEKQQRKKEVASSARQSEFLDSCCPVSADNNVNCRL